MAKNTSMSLGDHFESFVAGQIQQGRYGSASEVVRAGLRLLEEQEAKREALRLMILEGRSSGVADYTFDSLMQEMDAEQISGTLPSIEKAQEDLKNIARETQRRWGRDQRVSYLRQIDQTFSLLATQPAMGVHCGITLPPCRKFYVASHVVFYDLHDSGELFILRVLHKNLDMHGALSGPAL